MPEQLDIETWVINGNELEIIEALEDLATKHPEISLHWETAPRNLVDRRLQHDMSVVEIVVTAALTKISDGLLELAYAKLKELLKPSEASIRKKRKNKRRKR